jgi:cell division initiation protein
MASDTVNRNGTSPSETPVGQLISIDLTPDAHGLSTEQVRRVLSALSAELEPICLQFAELIRENEQIRRQSTRRSRVATEEEQDQAITLLTQAQEIADALIDDARVEARDMMLASRAYQRDVAKQAAAVPKLAEADGKEASSDDDHVIESLAKLAERQFLAVLDTLTEHVNRLGRDRATDAVGSPTVERPRQAAS